MFPLTVSKGPAVCRSALIFNPKATLCPQCCLRAYKEEGGLIMLVLDKRLKVFWFVGSTS